MERDNAEVGGLRPNFRRVRRWGFGMVVALVLVRSVVWFLPASVGAYTRGEVDLRGRRIYRPPFGVRPRSLATLKLERIHRDLLPGWSLTFNDETLGAASREKLAALRAETAGDPNLATLVEELAKAGELPRGAARANRFSYLIWAWNEYLDRAGAAWRLEFVVRLAAGHPRFYVKAYRVLATVRATLSGTACRARLVSRADRLNVVEGALGHTGSGSAGALVVLDRTQEFAENQLWSLLNEANDATLAPLDATFAPAVRDEAERSLPADAFAVLHETAPDRHALLQIAKVINDRRGCDRRFLPRNVPPAGLSEDILGLVKEAASEPSELCREVTPAEAEALAQASARLAKAPQLMPALAALNTWVARAVTIHELRHAADGGLDGEAPTSPCVDCSSQLSTATRGELSAYLTGLGTEGTTYVSAYQACGGAQDSSPAGAAVAALTPAVLPHGCSEPPPPDLAQRARRMEARLFRRSASVAFAEAFPSLDLAH